MSKTREIVSYLVIIYVSISVANHALTLLHKYDVNVWINRIVCVAVAALVGGVLGYFLFPKKNRR